jgi:hypothetical protein
LKYLGYLSLLFEVEVLAFERLVSNTEILVPGYSDLRQLNLNKRLRLPSPNIKHWPKKAGIYAPFHPRLGG